MNNFDFFSLANITEGKAQHLGRLHGLINVRLPNGKLIFAKAMTPVSSPNVVVFKEGNSYFCYCESSPFELSQKKQIKYFNTNSQVKGQSILFVCIDITRSLENKAVLQAINYINQTNYDRYSYLSFGDTVGLISNTLSKLIILEELQEFYDNFNSNYNSAFYHSEGTDLPENGIDAIVEAVNNIPSKYEDKEVYLVTDSDEYSRNINTAESVLNLKFKKIYFDIIEPQNINNPIVLWDSEGDRVLDIDNQINNNGAFYLKYINDSDLWVSPLSVSTNTTVEVNCRYSINRGSIVNVTSSFVMGLTTPTRLEFLLGFNITLFNFAILENTTNYFRVRSNDVRGTNLVMLSAIDLIISGGGTTSNGFNIVRPSEFIEIGDIIEIWIDSVNIISPVGVNRWYTIIRDGGAEYYAYPIDITLPIDVIPQLPIDVIPQYYLSYYKMLDISSLTKSSQVLPKTLVNSSQYSVDLPAGEKIIYL